MSKHTKNTNLFPATGPDSKYSKSTTLMGFRFNIDRRYIVQEIIGSGAYGVVASAEDTATGRQVAVKKLTSAFDHPAITKRTLRELKLMRLLSHDNLLSIEAIQLPTSLKKLDEIYIVADLMETDLSSIIKSDQVLTDEHCSFFLYQILRGLKYMHSAHVLHRDLKPRNILINEDCDLKICDFGLARVCNGVINSSTKMTDYVATRWYRSPELLLSFGTYTFAMDMWSVGCIFAEMLLRKPLLPGSSPFNQLERVLLMLGRPDEESILMIPDQEIRAVVKDISLIPRKPLERRLRRVNPLALDLVSKLLMFNPNRRITVDEALLHPYIAHLHCPADEPTVKTLSLFDFSFERRTTSIQTLKELIYEEILLYHSPSKREEYESEKQIYDEITAGLTAI